METDQGQAPVEVEQSEDQILERIRNVVEPPPEKSRDDKGRFAKDQPEQPEEGEEAPQEEAQDNAQEEGGDAPEETQEEEVTWEQLKEYKLKVPVKVNGEEREEEVTLEQLRNERMMQADYQRKTQELAKERSQAEQQLQAHRDELRQQALNELRVYEEAMMRVVAPEAQGVDLRRLAQEDPAEYVKIYQRQQEANQSLQAIRYQRYQIEQQQQAEQQQRIAQAVQQANQTLSTELQGWGQDMQKSLVKSAQAYGFADQELATVIDPRMIKVLHDAHKWRELQSQKPEVTKKVALAPKVLKPGAKRNANDDKARVEGDLRQRVEKSGGKDEAALQALIRQRMFGR